MTYLEREPGFENVKSFFAAALRTGTKLIMTSVNFGEVYYIMLRESGQQKAREVEKVIVSLPLDIVEVDAGLAKVAGVFKATKKMSYADCFAAALAKVRGGEVVTGDKEFRAVEDEVKIAWIG